MLGSADECKDYASKMLNQTLVTKQTGEAGINVGKVCPPPLFQGAANTDAAATPEAA